MRIEYPIGVAPLCAIREFAAKKDVRFYLEGVLFEQNKHGTFLAATDGLCVGAYRLDDKPADPVQIIIPNDLLKNIKPSRSAGTALLVAEEHWPSRWKLSLTIDGAAAFTGEAVDGEYPRWRAAVPQELTDKPQQVNPSLLVRFQRAAAILTRKSYSGTEAVRVGHCDGKLLVDIPYDPAFFGFVACWRMDAVTEVPAWARA